MADPFDAATPADTAFVKDAADELRAIKGRLNTADAADEGASAAEAATLHGSVVVYCQAITTFDATGMPASAMVIALGRNAQNDGGGGVFFYSSTGIETADNGFIFEPTGGGRVYRDGWTQFGFKKEIVGEFFGIFANGLDVGAEIQNAIDTVSALPAGGTIWMRGTEYRSSILLTIRTSGVLLRGNGQGFYNNAGAVPVTQLLYTGGVTADDFVLVSPVEDVANLKLTNVGVYDIALDGQGNVGRALTIKSVNTSHFAVAAKGATVAQVYIGCCEVLGGVRDTQHNDFEYFRALATGSAHSVVISTTIVGANVSMNNFNFIYGRATNGDGVRIENGDNNVFVTLLAERPSGTGIGVRMCAGDGVATASCYSNLFIHLGSGVGGVRSEGTPTNVVPATNNCILQLDKANGNPDPVIETDSTLSWGSNLGVFQVNLAMAKLALGASHAEAKAALAAMTTESLRIRNNSLRNLILDDSSGNEWIFGIDGATGNLRLVRAGGTGFFKNNNPPTDIGAACLVTNLPAAAITITTGMSEVLGTLNGANRNYTLPAANAYGANRTGRITIARLDTDAFVANILPAGADTINGFTSYVLGHGCAVVLISDGVSAWRVLEQGVPRFTWANKPAANAVIAGSRVWITDYGIPAGSEWISDGTRWHPARVVTLASTGAPFAVTGVVVSTAMLTANVRGNSMCLNGDLRLEANWSYTNSANIKNLRMLFDGTQFMQAQPTTTSQLTDIRGLKNRNVTNAQIASRVLSATTPFQVNAGAVVALAVDTTIDKTVGIYCQPANAADTVTLESGSIQLWPGL